MFRLILAILATMTAVVFVMANTHHVQLSFVVGSPVSVRMIFLLMSTFLLGILVSWMWGVVARVRWKRRVLNELKLEQASAKVPAKAGVPAAETR